MQKVCRILVFLAFLSSILLFYSLLYAEERTPLTDAKITPWGEIKVQYDDNVFLDSNDEKDDIIVTFTPGASFKLPMGSNLLKLDYHADIINFMDYIDQDAVDHYASGELDLNWRDVTFTIYDGFARVFERPSIEDTSRVKRDDNRAGVKAKLEKERLGLELGYEQFIRDYHSDPYYEQFDRKDNLYSLMLTHQTFDKTKLLLEYDFGQIRYDQSVHSDSDYHQFLVGAMGEITPKTKATIKTGYQFREYEDSNQPNFDTGVLYADMTHKFSEKNAIKLSFLRSANESTYGTNNFYKVENVSAVFDHLFNNKWRGFITGAYDINSYPRETTEGTVAQKRKDTYSSLGAGLKYYMREWLTFTLRGDHIIRDSNFDVYEYAQNLITFTARAEF